MRITTTVRSFVRGLSAVLVLSAGLAAAAHADSTETLAFQGTWDHSPDCWELPDQCVSGPPQEVTGTWSGTVAITLPSFTDGSYDASSAHVVLTSLLGRFDTTELDSIPLTGWVTVSGGGVAAIDATWYYADSPDVTLTFDGVSMTYDQPAHHHYGPTVGSATLEIPVPTIPEPSGWALALAGLAVVGGLRRPVSRASRAAA
ncbi:MAG: hypothetical protein ACTHL8_25860 [Burkholderiaceae bacterium]